MMAQFWSHRLDADHLTFGLSAYEYRIQLCLIYTGEISNGGHAQFVDNRGTERVASTISALQTVGLHLLARVLASADELLRRPSGQGSSVPADWRQLDVAAWKSADWPRCDRALLAYAREHADEILVPERA
ncbi:MAG: DUF4375 domain-containing protein [Acidobacteriota bacterium]